MVGHVARGMVATDPRTWVHTVLVDTCEMSWTLRIDNTFWFTLNVWVACVVSDAGTASSVTLLSTHSIDTTGGWVTWFYDNW